MMMNTGIRPALKYIVMMRKRYQNLRPHMRDCVNMNPRNAEASTVSTVPITVRPRLTTAAIGRPGQLEHLRVVGQVESDRPQAHVAERGDVVGADRVDDQVVEGVRADQREQQEQRVVRDAEQDVADRAR